MHQAAQRSVPRHAAYLAAHRPHLAAGFAAALPGARATVLARLFGALTREPFPGRGPVVRTGATVTVTLSGHEVRGPAAAAGLFHSPSPGLTIGGYTDPADLAATLWPDRPDVAADLDDSVANLALGRAAPPARRDHTDLADAEQSVVDGHPIHPCCRTRAGFSCADILAYGPEHRPVVALPVIAVPPDRWYTTGAGLPPRLVMHPWQWQHHRDKHPYLEDTGERLAARPLISLRTFAVPGRHVKTALDVRLTNHVRTVSPESVHNGPLATALLARLTRATPGLGVMADRAGGAVIVDGAPDRSLAMIERPAPDLSPGEMVAPLAALGGAAGRAHPDGPVGLVADVARLLVPALHTLLDLGVALDAHGQNLLVVRAGGRAVRLVYRDLGGIRVSPAALARHGVECPPLVGDLPCDDPAELRTRAVSSAVTSGLGLLVTTLAGDCGEEPAHLWAAVGGPYDGTLPLKAMTVTRFEGGEDRWTAVPNPMAGAAW